MLFRSGSPAKKNLKKGTDTKKGADKTSSVVRTSNLAPPPAEEEEVPDEAAFAGIVSELGKKIKQHFQGKHGWGPKQVRDRLVKFLNQEKVEDEHLVAYLRVLEEEAKDDSGASRNPFRKNLIDVINSMVVSIITYSYSFLNLLGIRCFNFIRCFTFCRI